MVEDRTLLLFTKPARPGRVKTRLIGAAAGELTAEEASALHWALVLDQVERLRDRDFSLRISWALEKDETPPDLGLPAETQTGEDLGERLLNGLVGAARCSRYVAAVGSDHPHLTLGLVQQGFRRLAAGVDLVLGPTSDGGYYLIGLRAERVDRRLFAGIPWSTDGVLAATLDRAGQLGLEIALLDEGDDVDTPADLSRLGQSLAARPADSPRAHALLASWGRLA